MRVGTARRLRGWVVLIRCYLGLGDHRLRSIPAATRNLHVPRLRLPRDGIVRNAAIATRTGPVPVTLRPLAEGHGLHADPAWRSGLTALGSSFRFGLSRRCRPTIAVLDLMISIDKHACGSGGSARREHVGTLQVEADWPLEERSGTS